MRGGNPIEYIVNLVCYVYQPTCRGRVVHVDVVVLRGHGLLHEGLVEHDSVHLDVIFVLD